MHRKAATPASLASIPPIVHEVIRSPGRELDTAARGRMESALGHDFSRVRVHTDGRAQESAASVGALAYSVGSHVVFGAGQYAPRTSAGSKLLAHELTHVAQQGPDPVGGELTLDGGPQDPLEVEADRVAERVDETAPHDTGHPPMTIASGHGRATIHRRVRPENVSCRANGLRNPDLTGDQVVAAIEAADAEAIELALRAELLLDWHRLFAEAGEPVDAAFDRILREELGLTLTNPAHFRLVEQQANRFRRVRETLESGYLRYMCRGGTVRLAGCTDAPCGVDFAFTCPANRLVVLCQEFWNTPGERGATILHEPFHILFDMANHAPAALRRADADCFESFALRVAGRAAPASCAAHTNG